MPIYSFQSKNGRIVEKVLKISELEDFLRDNPKLKQVIVSINIGDPVRLGVTKQPDSVKDLYKKISKKHPRNTMNLKG